VGEAGRTGEGETPSCQPAGRRRYDKTCCTAASPERMQSGTPIPR
jgi:hypothetical protein